MFFKSDCTQVKSLLWDIASGKVTGSECELATAHLERCEACRSELESYRNTISLLAEYKRELVPASRLGWRDVERRVAAQGTNAGVWVKRPLAQLALGGGSIAFVSALMMFVLQANMNPKVRDVPAHGGQTVAKVTSSDAVSAPSPVDFPAAAGILALTDMPRIDEDESVTTIRTAPPHSGRMALRAGPTIAANVHSAPALQVAANDVNVDGGSPVQALPVHYVLTSASSGNDDDQNRRDPIDVVSTSRSAGDSDGSEESHPW